MSAHGQSTSVNEETPQEEQQQSIPTYEDKLAGKLEEGAFAPEQQQSSQITLALLFGASTHVLEIRRSLGLLRGGIDINELINNPKYKAEIERAVQLTNRYGRIVKKGDLVDIIPCVETALSKIETLHKQISKVKKDLSHQYAIEIRQVYGITDEQLKIVKERALERIRENPKLSMKDAMRMEAREMLVKTVEKEVNSDKSVKAGDRKKEVEKRLDGKDKEFLEHPQTGKVYNVEEELCDGINNRGIDSIKDVLGVESKPTTQSTSSLIQPSNTLTNLPPQPGITTLPTTSPFPVISPPLSSVSVSQFNLPKFSLPQISFPHISFPKISFGGLGDGGLGSQIGSFMGNGLRSFFGSGGLLSKGLSGGLNLAKSALPKLASFALPPFGAALAAITAIDTLTGGMATKVIGLLIGGVAVIIIAVPLIAGVGVYSFVTGSNSVKLTSTKNNTISWKEFEKQYLTADRQFLSSLDTNRHDNVEK